MNMTNDEKVADERYDASMWHKGVEVSDKEKIRQYLSADDRTTTPLILIGDVIEELRLLPAESVNLIITSPPYWKQRDYRIKGQIGQEGSPEEYVQKLADVGDELKRVLKKDGSFFLNIGDKYGAKKDLLMIPSKLAIEMQRRGWILRNFIVWYKPNHMPTSVGDRFGTTWEPVFFFVKDTGTYLSPKYYFNLDEVRIPHKTKENDIPEGLPLTVSEEDYEKIKEKLKKLKKDYNGKFKNHEINRGASPGARSSLYGFYYSKQRVFKPTKEDEIEIIKYLREWRKRAGISTQEIDKSFGYKHTAGHWFRLDEGGRSLPQPEDWIKLKKLLGFDDRYDEVMIKTHYVLQAVKKHPNGKNPGDMWSIRTDRLEDEHFAIFPEELVRRIIKAACPPDGVVLDHFAGSGTTGKVAMELGRKSIIIDIKPEYADIMKKRFKLNQKDLLDFMV